MVGVRGRGGRRHPDHQGAARRAHRQPHRVDRRHHQRHHQLHPVRDARQGPATSTTVLKEAQRLGYAEADPTFDIEGIDAAHKLTIMCAIAFGMPMQFDKALRRRHHRSCTRAGHPLRRAARLPHQAARHHAGAAPQGIELRVHPTLVPTQAPDRQRRRRDERGAGARAMRSARRCTTARAPAREPTASAVIADLVDITRLHTADPEHRVPHLAFQPDAADRHADPADGRGGDRYYLRLRVADQAGVLADITAHPGRRTSISIDAMLQKRAGRGRGPDRHHHPHARHASRGSMNEAIAQMRRCRRCWRRSCASARKS